MFQFFTKLFRKMKKHERIALVAKLAPESLESRDLPSAGPGLITHGFNLGPQAHVGTYIPPPANVDYGGVLEGTTSHSSTTTVLTAVLTGVTGAAGTATFTSNTTAATNSFLLTISGLTASTTYTVQIDGTTIGQVTTDASGNGSLSLTNLSATVQSGSIVSVLDTTTTPSTTELSGTLGMGNGCHAGSSLTASLTGATGTSGSAAYWSDTASGTNGLKVKVSGLTASSTYTVDVGTTAVGQITTDASGDGTLSLKNITATIAAGTTITVLDTNGNTVLTGTFAAGANGAEITLHAAHAKSSHQG